MYQLMIKLKRLKGVIKNLNKGKYSNIEKKYEAAKKGLSDLQLLIYANMQNAQLLEEERVAVRELS